MTTMWLDAGGGDARPARRPVERPHAPQRRRAHRRRPTPGRVAAAIGAAVVVALLVLAGAAAARWHADGGRWFVVTSPSMGEAAPVGSLLLTTPTRVDEVPDGTFITFHAPGSGKTFSHRAIAHTDDGLTTQGDINLVEDPWTVTDRELIGRVAVQIPVLGWVVRALPLFFCGLAVTWLLTAWVRPTRRYGVRVTGTALTLAVAGWILHPWVGLMTLAQTTPDDGSAGVLMEVVSTGLLPITVADHPGSLQSGQVATVHLTHAEHGRYPVNAHPALDWWQWALLALVVLSPMLWTSLRGLPPVPAESALGEDPDNTADDVGSRVAGGAHVARAPSSGSGRGRLAVPAGLVRRSESLSQVGR